MGAQKILFPTDFSETSLNAFSFALEYARRAGDRIVVFHAYEGDAGQIGESHYTSDDITTFRNKKDVFPPFEKIKNERGYGDVVIKYVVKEGSFLNEFRSYIEKKEDHIDLVVMGTENNKSRLLEFFTDSKTIKLLMSVNKPVIAVPEAAHFDGTLDNIVFLVDFREGEIEVLNNLITQCEAFESKIHVLHFDLAHKDSIVSKMSKLKDEISADSLSNVIFKTIDSVDLRKSLTEYCEENEIDIVYLINYHRNFYQRMFTYGVAEDLIKEMQIPIMSIYKE